MLRPIGRIVPDLPRAIPTFLAACAVVLSACGSPAANPASSSPSPSATVAASPTATSTAMVAATPSRAAAPSAAPIPTAPFAVRPGEPWIVYEGPVATLVGNRAVRPDGSGDQWLTPEVPLPPKGWQAHPDWSRDGVRLAFAADDAGDPPGSGTAGEGTRDLWVSRADGTGAERVLDCKDPCTQADDPAWSPDERTLAFVTWDLRDGKNVGARLALLDLQTRAVRTLLTVKDDRDAFAWPRWSPDGRRIVLERQRWSDLTSNANLIGTTIGVVGVDGPTHTFTQLTDSTLWATYPDWHPTQDLIVFSTRPWDPNATGPDFTGPSNLYTIRPDGSGKTQLTHLGPNDRRAAQPTWSPDGRQIIFTLVEGAGFGHPTMATILPDGTGLTSATTSGPMFGTHPRLRPTP